MGVVQKQVYNGKTGKVSGMQGEQDLEGDDLETLKTQGAFFPATNYIENGYQLELEGMEMVDGEKAYILKVTDPKEEVSTEYYSAETGLKIRESSVVETPQGEVVSAQIFGDYQEKSGVMFPMTMSIEGGQKVVMTVKELNVNTGLKAADFK
jgi:hypothetical protein